MKAFLLRLGRFLIHPNIFTPFLMILGGIISCVLFFSGKIGATNFFEAFCAGAAIVLATMGIAILFVLSVGWLGTLLINIYEGIKEAIRDSKK